MTLTIQPMVDKMNTKTGLKFIVPMGNKINHDGRMSIAPEKRTTIIRNTESVSGTCKICNASSWDTDINRGETICSECGFVATQNMIDPGADWINHSGSDDRSRVGAPSTLTLSDRGLSTEIRKADLTASAAKRHGMTNKGIKEWRRRQVIDQRSKTRDSRARNLSIAMQFIRDRGDLPSQIEQEAASLYRHSINRGLVTGRSIRGVSASCVYLAARQAKIPRTIDEIAESFNMTSEIEQKELKRTIRLVARNLGAQHITGPEEYFEKFHSDLKLPPNVLGIARDLWDAVKEDLDWQGKKPSGIAGVIMYKASQESASSRTQKEVCRVSGISEVTLRGLLKILDRKLKYIYDT